MTLDKFITEDNVSDYPLSKLAANEWKEFALYTVEARAIPNMIDGMKPSQRFYLYSSILNTKTDFKKVESVAGQVTDYGYNHGTTSAASTGQGMAAEWANNVLLVEGRGSFGTRLVQSAAAARYTQTRLHPNFGKYVTDLDLSPVHHDPEHMPPAFYLPIIPLVLANGVKGIATGFATSILPRDPLDLAKACEEYITKGKISNSPSIKFPQFSGTVKYVEEENRFYCYGVFERKSKTVIQINEVPYGFDREDYVKILDDLEEKDLIVSYDDLCDKSGFCFEVKLKQQTSANWTDEQIIKEFKLVKPHTENITVIGPDGKLREYKSANQLIADFCDYRMGILSKRIQKKIDLLTEEARWLTVKMEFIQAILNEAIVFKNKKKAEISHQILSTTTATQDDCDKLLRINIMSLTQELVDELAKQIADALSSVEEWKQTTPEKQFMSDLKKLESK